MPLQLYRCKACSKELELFDDEVKEGQEVHIETCETGILEMIDTSPEASTAMTERLFQSQYRQYSSIESKNEWAKKDLKRVAKEKQAELFTKNAYK